jgi:putative PIN family toxin of toxin-antitoxin system
MSHHLHQVVYDCVVYGQALINPDGPAGQCIEEARRGHVRLYISDFVLAEIRELPVKIKSKIVTFEQAEGLADSLLEFAVFVKNVPVRYTHPIDTDDSAYINLAVATDSKLIVSRDRHLLGMMDNTFPFSADFRRQFPDLRILPPDAFMRLLRSEQQNQEP